MHVWACSATQIINTTNYFIKVLASFYNKSFNTKQDIKTMQNCIAPFRSSRKRRQNTHQKSSKYVQNSSPKTNKIAKRLVQVVQNKRKQHQIFRERNIQSCKALCRSRSKRRQNNTQNERLGAFFDLKMQKKIHPGINISVMSSVQTRILHQGNDISIILTKPWNR